jgi:hypothetical protein
LAAKNVESDSPEKANAAKQEHWEHSDPSIQWVEQW